MSPSDRTDIVAGPRRLALALVATLMVTLGAVVASTAVTATGCLGRLRRRGGALWMARLSLAGALAAGGPPSTARTRLGKLAKPDIA